MLRFFSKKPPHNPLNIEDIRLVVAEAEELERALISMDLVLDGQIDQAQKFTKTGNVFPKIATGVLRFIEATVSFESDAINKSIEALSLSEHSASAMKSKAQQLALKTSKFRPGAEFELAEYESALLAAISMLLTESKLDILKALYKIRKTYLSLEELRKHVESNSQKTPEFEADLTEFNKLHQQRTKNSNLTSPSKVIEEYIMSGVDVMCGLLHLILSSVPPTIQKLLSVVGLSGNREIALEMMWRASNKYSNIHGSLALIALIMFFDAQLQYKDIELSHDKEMQITSNVNGKMTPKELRATENQLLQDLQRMRKFYPHGVLWLLQQGRLIAHKDLLKGVSILESKECGPNQMRQVEGLLIFDRTMFLLSLDRLEEASQAFVDLKEVSTWSHPLYMYLSAACQLELYRREPDLESLSAKKHKQLANERFAAALTVGGKRKVLGRKMPFDTFVQRKVTEFQQVAKKNKVDLCDAVTTSPLYEALYFWNGNARMSAELAQQVVQYLRYSTSPRAKVTETSNDKFTRQVLEVAYLRCAQKNSDEGYTLVDKLAHEVAPNGIQGKKVYRAKGEPWAGPAALYERAIYEFNKFEEKNAQNVHKWLDLSADWDGDYELSTRISMKVSGARDRLAVYKL